MDVEIVKEENEKPDPSMMEKRLQSLKDRLDGCVAKDKLTQSLADQIFENFGNEDRFEKLVLYVEHYENAGTMEQEEKFKKLREGEVDNAVSNESVANVPRKIVGQEPEPEAEKNTKDEYKKFLATVIHRPFPKVEASSAKFQEITLPSGNLFYGDQVVTARKLNFEDMRKLARVAKTPNPQLTIEAIRNCISIDVQLLTLGDFVYFLYWLRSVSLPKSPITLSWKSRYGTNEKMTVTLSKFKETRIEPTEELIKDFKYYTSLGLTFPRVYDMTSALDFEIDVEDPEVEQWVLEQVQYLRPIPGERVGERISRYSGMMEDGLELLDELNSFKEKFAHGVEEVATVQVDPKKFDPKAAIVHLRREADIMIKISEQAGFDPEIYNTASEYRAEADEIEAKIEKGEGVIPRSEQLNVRIDLQSFFSGI